MVDTFYAATEVIVMEQRCQAVPAVIADGRAVGEVAAQYGVSVQSVHVWLLGYQDHGLERLIYRPLKPESISLHPAAQPETVVLELRGGIALGVSLAFTSQQL